MMQIQILKILNLSLMKEDYSLIIHLAFPSVSEGNTRNTKF